MRTATPPTGFVGLLLALMSSACGGEPAESAPRAYLTVVSSLSEACPGTSTSPTCLRVRVTDYDGGADDFAACFSQTRTFEPGRWPLTVGYDIFGCNVASTPLTFDFEDGQHVVILYANQDGYGNETVVQRAVTGLEPYDGTRVLFANVASSSARFTLEADGVTGTDLELGTMEVGVLPTTNVDTFIARADVGGQVLSANYTNAYSGYEWDSEFVVCSLRETAAGEQSLTCQIDASMGNGAWFER